MDAGLVKGEGFAVDASVMEADASRYHGRAPDEIDWSAPERQTRAVNEFLAALDAETPNADRTPPKLQESDPLQIVFTSGTTGDPKGIVHTHGNVLASLRPIEAEMAKYLRYEKLVHPIRILHTLPLSHVFGQFMGLWVPPLMAAEVHYESRLVASELVSHIKHERISVLAAVPRVLDLLQQHMVEVKPKLGSRISAAAGTAAAPDPRPRPASSPCPWPSGRRCRRCWACSRPRPGGSPWPR